MSQAYWIDDDGYLACETGNLYGAVGGSIKPEHIEPLSRILDSHDDLLAACDEGEKRIKFLLDKILAEESFPEKIILERIEIDKTFACMSFIKEAIAKAERSK